MIDQERRKKLALHLRHLSVGVITNDDFESNVMDDVTNGWSPEQYYRAKEAKSDDPIITPMLELCWGLYSDTKNYRLKGRDQLSDETLKVIARCILFLHSDEEYEWPYFDSTHPIFKFSLKDFVKAILTLGQHYRDKKFEREQSYIDFQKTGDYDYWPFLKKADYLEELNNQPFLAPKSATI
ncbi:MAG: hypothetical protein JWR50_1958 [Mucilaginibacter sp.]|nr:hypothetical protein [Mucilaginibacter sp.]